MLGKPLILQFSGADAPIKPGVITTSSDFVPYFYQIFGWFASLHLLSYQEFTDTTKNIGVSNFLGGFCNNYGGLHNAVQNINNKFGGCLLTYHHFYAILMIARTVTFYVVLFE